MFKILKTHQIFKNSIYFQILLESQKFIDYQNLESFFNLKNQ